MNAQSNYFWKHKMILYKILEKKTIERQKGVQIPKKKSFRSPKEFQSEVQKNSFGSLKGVHLKAQNYFVLKSKMISLGRQKWFRSKAQKKSSRKPKIIQFRKKNVLVSKHKMIASSNPKEFQSEAREISFGSPKE